jgi:hypothetical protein
VTTPVVYLIFNRPDLTERTFAALRVVRPRRLHVVADGPRAGRPDEARLCAAARAATERVDWPCEVTRDYADANLGCGRRVSTGITRAFETVEEAIILEDDCLPDPSFFSYCTELLQRYRGDERVMAVSGNNFQAGARTPYSYYFSKYMHCWGWATWRRAWARYDFHMSGLIDYLHSPAFRAWCPQRRERAHWRAIFMKVAAGKLDTWDYQWLYSCWRHAGLTALPEVNLVSNLGFRGDATHTRDAAPLADLPVGAIGPLVHPPDVKPNVEADRYTFQTVFCGADPRASQSLLARAARKFGRLLRRPGRAG